MPDIERITAAGRVQVITRIDIVQTVIGRVIQAPMAQCRTELISLGRVIEDDVEQHLQSGLMQRVDHRLELLDLAAEASSAHCRGIGMVRCEIADRVVSPIIRQTPLYQEAFRHTLVYWEQLDRSDTQFE